MTLLAASVVQPFVAGSHSSAVRGAWPGLRTTKPPPLVPPVTSTCPSGRIVAFMCRRATDIEPALCHEGEVTLRLIFSAVAVGAPDFASGVPQLRSPPPPT